jgi:hypothetical protein
MSATKELRQSVEKDIQDAFIAFGAITVILSQMLEESDKPNTKIEACLDAIHKILKHGSEALRQINGLM